MHPDSVLQSLTRAARPALAAWIHQHRDQVYRHLDTMGLQVLKTEPVRAGFQGNAMMRSMARGQVHDPNTVVAVELTLTGPVELLLSRDAMTLALTEARREGLYSGFAHRTSQVHVDREGRMVAKFRVDA